MLSSKGGELTQNTVGLSLGTVGIAATVGLRVCVHWRTSKTLLSILRLVSSLLGGGAATRTHEHMSKAKQARDVPYQTNDGKWAIAWTIPHRKEKVQKP
jgi:hypothetical protein